MDLNPEVQQMISYYDDLYVYSDCAYEMGILIYEENRELKNVCREKVNELRQSNVVDYEDDNYIYEAVLVIGSFLPYIGTVCDILSDTTIVQAATFDRKELKGLTYQQARGLEHKVFEKYGGVVAVKAGRLFNKIRPLNMAKEISAKYIAEALKSLGRIS